MLVEVEAIINSRPITYVGEVFKSGLVLTPTHFLTGNRDVIPSCLDYSDDVDYILKMDSVKELSKYWKRSQKQLDQFWESWKHEYLFNLREMLPLVHKNHRSQLERPPRIGEMVIVKDEHIPHRTWRLAKIEEFIYSKDGKIRSAKILFANKNVVTRAVSHLFPLEINSQFSCEESVVKLDQASESGVKFNRTSTDLRNVSRRKAAEEARRRICRQLTENATCILFCFPPGVSQTC